ncbi:hypothetical protein OHC33_010667 [Knufia fluminis]|uniref:Uncharacterized protein n=1 Tax=Knufia fluminis TaxID=191047 RepID=A0AAN8EYH0_9EURO|nr:hypothetical protein OHC33_010667 [Knufia fluminis]
MPAPVVKNPYRILKDPIVNKKIDWGRSTRSKGQVHHCPVKPQHTPGPQCLIDGHLGYCNNDGHIGNPFHGCSVCGGHVFHQRPESRRFTGRAGRTGGLNAIASDLDAIVQTEEEDKEWTVADERAAKKREDQEKALREATQGNQQGANTTRKTRGGRSGRRTRR